MRAMQFQKPGFADLQAVELPEPVCGDTQVALKMTAASCNFRDFAVAMGKYPGVQYPVVPLSDGVGIVQSVGSKVKKLKVGDRVCPIFSPRWLSGPPTDLVTSPGLGGEIDGVLREQMVLDELEAVLVPSHLTDREAATLPCAAVTAWSALIDFGRVKPGDTVLIEGTGGVSLFALQFAKLAGARVVLISSSDEKLERGKAMGADITLNYKTTPEWGGDIYRQTGGVDVVIETVGAATLMQAVAAVNKGGKIAQIGLLSGVGATLPLQFLVPRGVTLQGIVVGGRDKFEDMTRAIAQHELRPVLGHSFGFTELASALALMAPGGQHFGKITLDIV